MDSVKDVLSQHFPVEMIYFVLSIKLTYTGILIRSRSLIFELLNIKKDNLVLFKPSYL